MKIADTMVTVNDVYRKIKELSSQAWNPRPPVPVANLSKELSSPREHLLPMLVKLEDMKLIRFNESAKTSIRLTLLGNAVERTKS